MAKNLSLLLFSLFTHISVAYSQSQCCCGTVNELNLPGLDFEFSPDPPPAWFINYPGGPMGPWNITSGSVDHVEKDHYFCSSCGNPNGPSNFIDLFGSPSGPGYGVGTMQYTLTGLTPGSEYTIEFYYAKFDKPGNYTANLKIGSWLNVNWTATNPGNIVWLKASYKFTAQSPSGSLEFKDTGNNTINGSQIGMLIDDIKIFECPVDVESPFVNNAPDDFLVECENDVPIIPILNISDNCDINPKVTFKEKTEIIDSCTQKITREWIIKDACGNITTEDQIIDIIDQNPPTFIKLPENKEFTCDKDIIKEFNDWIRKHGNATAIDACPDLPGVVTYDHLPDKFCDLVSVEFIARDHCGNESIESASFSVIDTTAPKFIVKAVDKNFICISNTKDSLRDWLNSYGFSKTSTECDVVILSSNFNGDSTKNPLKLTFFAQDNCGNIDSCTAVFSYRNNSDTFRIKNYSCSFTQNSIDTIPYKQNGCDSIVILEKIKLLPDSVFIQSNTCDPTHKLFDTLRLLNISGCDSLIFKNYILQPVSITNLQNSNCTIAQYSIDTVHLSGQYCDSLIITEHLPLRKDTISIIQNTCDISIVDTSIQLLTNNVGCDSVVTVYTLYNPQQMTFIDTKVCGLAISFVDTITFKTALCDSLVITNHIPLPLDTTNIQSTTCDKIKSGMFMNHFSNQYGCDSFVVNEILLNPSDSILISNTTCDLSQSGIVIQQFKNKFGCDSIVQTFTNFIPSDTTLITQHTCDVTQVGVDTIVIARNNCDSIVFRYTILNLSDTTQLTQITCIPANAGLSRIFLQNVNGCDSLLLIQTNYAPLHLNFDLDSISCFNLNDGIFRILNSSDFNKPFELILNNNIIGNQSQITNLGPGSYEIYLRDQKGCITDSIQFTLINPKALLVDLGNDLEVKKGTTINLNLQSNRTLQNIYWQPVNLTNCNNCNQINFIVNEDTWIYANAIDDRNCNQLDSIFIHVKKSGLVFAPNSFSPNGDNINDYFYIHGDSNAIVEEMFIYDRWGNQVFETFNMAVNEPLSGWNGTFKSQKMIPGVFVYYAKVRLGDQDQIVLKGDLTLFR